MVRINHYAPEFKDDDNYQRVEDEDAADEEAADEDSAITAFEIMADDLALNLKELQLIISGKMPQELMDERGHLMSIFSLLDDAND